MRSRARSAEVQAEAGIRDQTAVKHAQRIGNGLGREDIIQRDRLLHMCVRMQQRMLARLDRDMGKLLPRGAILVHVPLRDHGVVARNRAAIWLLEIGMPDRQQRADRGIARLSRGPVFAGADKDRLGLASRDGFGRVLEHHCRAAAADHHRGIVVRLQAEVFAQHRTQHEIGFGERIGGQQAVDVGHLQSGIIQRAPGGLRIQAQPRHMGNAPDLGFPDTDNGDLVLERCNLLHIMLRFR
nr:hypothetical protein [Cupriavidus taiwanensis]